MRQSVAPTRAPHAVSSVNQPPNPAALARLQEKKKEFEAVAALEKASAMFVKRIEGLGDDCDVMADAGLGG
jgi:DASH complex subunit DAD2